MIGIIDYGAGNLKSVQNALEHLHAPSEICTSAAALTAFSHIILPGVGAFPDCMEQLQARGFLPVIKQKIADGIPFLGICLGMQVLFESSDEIRSSNGLGILKGRITLMEDPAVKIPHIGWNDLIFTKQDALFDRLVHPYVYYVHSYRAVNYDENDLIAYSTYGSLRIPGAFHKNNVWACQFHPEKSGQEGLTILANFLNQA